MIRSLAVLLVCQLAGEVIVRGAGLPLPGPVIGMLLLVAALVALDRAAGTRAPVGRAIDGLGRTTDAILANLGLLFVPAGVGVIRHLDLIAAHGPALLATLVGSVTVTLVVSVAAFRATARLTGRGDTAEAGGHE